MNPEIQLTRHFKLKEFLKNGSTEGLTLQVLENLRTLAQKLEEIRKLLGNRPMTITSGFRSWEHHLRIYREIAASKGVPFNLAKVPRKSYHLTGMAADFMVKGLSSEEARKIIDPVWDGGMELQTAHVHLDTGPRRRFYP